MKKGSFDNPLGFWYDFEQPEGESRMAKKEFEKKEFEKIFSHFGKRQDQKFKVLEERVVHRFHVISEGLIDHIKLLAEGHTGIIDRLDRMEKENEHQHLETRALVKPRCCITEPGQEYFQNLAIADFSEIRGHRGCHFR